jgi:drug/metabolite transporter (DMT)-like permease
LLDRVPLVRLGAALFFVPVVGVVAAVVVGGRPASVELIGIATVLVGIRVVPVAEASPPLEAAT